MLFADILWNLATLLYRIQLNTGLLDCVLDGVISTPVTPALPQTHNITSEQPQLTDTETYDTEDMNIDERQDYTSHDLRHNMSNTEPLEHLVCHFVCASSAMHLITMYDIQVFDFVCFLVSVILCLCLV